jgi:tetratricopeptide (TPR) repeat protein
MSSTDLDREVRESLAKLSTVKMPAPQVEGSLLNSQKLSPADAHVLQASLSLFGPDGDRTLKELVDLMRQNQENVAVHRELAWAFLLRNDRDNAVEHIRRALALNDSDPAMHYLYARWVNDGDDNHINLKSAEPRMGPELKAALKRRPNYAAALELLGLAELNDGNTKPALANLQRASALLPRNNRYYLNLARAYETDGNLDAARNLLLYARSGDDATVSAEVGELLSELGKEKKRQEQWKVMGLQTDADVKHSKYDNLQEAIAEDERAESKSKSPEASKDMRKIEYMKGRIVRVECGSAPSATLVVSYAGQTWQMYTSDRNALILIGVDHFDCGWHDNSVSINYKRSGNLRGDLVSLEAN